MRDEMYVAAVLRAALARVKFASIRGSLLRVILAGLLIAISCATALGQGDLRGHGGPVRALSVSPAGDVLVSGSFDQSAIVWTLATGRANLVLRGHEGPVNAVLALADGFLSGGDDGKVIAWSGQGAVLAQARLHDAPVSSLARSPDGALFASGGWDGVVKLWSSPEDKSVRSLEGHKGLVNAVAFMPDGRTIVSGGYDATIRLWPREGGTAIIVTVPSPVSSLVVTGEGLIAAGCADGAVVFLDAQGRQTGTFSATDTPVTSLAASPDGLSLAAGSPRGAVTVIDVRQQSSRFTLNGPGLPAWSMAYTRDGRFILSGGADRMIRRWDAATGDPAGPLSGGGDDDELAAFRDMPGAEIFKACAVCHTLRPDGAGRAGPTLHGLFGRKAGRVPGYAYSEAFRQLDLVWTPQTVSRLFELGPQTYTPGTKMPEQTVGNAQERQALIDFLVAATARRSGADAR